MGKTKDVRMAVEKELGFDPRVDSCDIKVMTMGGNVNLTGTVPSFPQYLQASAAARRVAAPQAVAGLTGIRNVQNDIEISCDIDPVDVDLHVQEALDPSALVPDGSDVKGRHQGRRHHADRPRPHLGRTRRSARRRADGPRVIDVRDNLQITG